MQIDTDCDTRVRLYCRGMSTDSPTEYVSLLSGPKDNYAYVYGYKQPYASREECVKADGEFVSALCAAILLQQDYEDFFIGSLEDTRKTGPNVVLPCHGAIRQNYNLVSRANSKCLFNIVTLIKVCFLPSFNLFLYHSCNIIYQARQSRKGDQRKVKGVCSL